MGMTDLELRSVYKTNYRFLLSIIRTKMNKPEEYRVAAEIVEEFRDFVKDVAQIDDLPEVPKL